MQTYERIYKVVQAIPAGFVLTYGDVAKLAKTSPRVVGNALHANPDETGIPCHRVVNAKGKLSAVFAFGGVDEQASRLEAEGVEIENYSVDLIRFRQKR